MKLFFESEFPTRGIDVENGVVKGATICTAGIEAKGHGLKTDDVLLRQLLVSARKKGAVPVGLDHRFRRQRHRGGGKKTSEFLEKSSWPTLNFSRRTLISRWSWTSFRPLGTRWAFPHPLLAMPMAIEPAAMISSAAT